MTYILNILTINNSFDLLLILIVATAKATFLIGFAALLCLIFRRFSAAARHLIWILVLCASLLLPLLSFVKGWEISVLPTALNSSSASELNLNHQVIETPKTQILAENIRVDSLETKKQNNDPGVQESTKFFTEPLMIPNASGLQTQPEQKVTPSFLTQLFNLLLGVWIIGACLFLLRLLTGIISSNLLARQTVEFENPALINLFSSLLTELNLKNNIRLLNSERTLMPIVCGIWKPVVILPAIAESWTEERCRMVLLHELTHIARRDCLTQMLAQVVCIFYWFNPFIWFAAHRLRVEREQACDAYVLSIGTKPSDYAGHLLEIARSVQEKKRSVFEYSPTTTIAMAQQSQLETRLLAILNPKNKNRQVSQLATVSLMTLIGILFLSLVIIHPTTTNANSSQIADVDGNVKAETTTEGKSFLDLFSVTGSKSQDELINESAEKPETDSDAEETLEKPTESKVENEHLIAPDNLADSQPTTDESLTETENAEQIPTPIANPSPNPFVNVEFTQEKQTESQVQEKQDDFIDEMASVGYKNLSVDDLIRLKSVGVTGEYVKGLRAFGIDNLTVKELTNFRAVGVTPKYIEGIRNAGYKEATVKELASLKVHNITPEYISKFRDAGFSDLSIRDLVSLKTSNMTIEFINTINSMGFGKLTLKELTSLKFNSVTPEFIRLARSRLGNELTLRQIISLKHTGILKDKDKE